MQSLKNDIKASLKKTALTLKLLQMKGCTTPLFFNATAFCECRQLGKGGSHLEWKASMHTHAVTRGYLPGQWVPF